jgi:hypothetical protein
MRQNFLAHFFLPKADAPRLRIAAVLVALLAG